MLHHWLDDDVNFNKLCHFALSPPQTSRKTNESWRHRRESLRHLPSTRRKRTKSTRLFYDRVNCSWRHRARTFGRQSWWTKIWKTCISTRHISPNGRRVRTTSPPYSRQQPSQLCRPAPRSIDSAWLRRCRKFRSPICRRTTSRRRRSTSTRRRHRRCSRYKRPRFACRWSTSPCRGTMESPTWFSTGASMRSAPRRR